MRNLIITCLLVAASCGDAAAVASAPTATPSDGAIPWSTAMATPTPAPIPTPALVPCRAADIDAAFTHWGINGGGFLINLVGKARCGLPANPAYRFITKYGQTLPWPRQTLTAFQVPVDTKLADGRQTVVNLQWERHTGDPAWACHDRSPMLRAVEIQSGGAWIRLPFERDPMSLCTDPLDCCFMSADAPEVIPPQAARNFDAKIIAPLSARAGEHMRYLVQITNRTNVPQHFTECPAYVHNIAGPQELGSADRPGFRYIERRQILNCGTVGAIAPGASVTFEMFFDIPADVLPGGYVLPWRLDGPQFSTGDKVGLSVTR